MIHPDYRAQMEDKKRIQNVEQILIIRNDGIGDALNSTPAIAALREAYPDAHISVLVRSPGAEILQFNPHIDETIIYDETCKSLRGRLRFYRNLRARNSDLVVALRNSSQSNFMALISGAKYRIGYKAERKRFSFALTHGTRSRHPKGTQHEVDRNLEIVGLIGVKSDQRDLILRLSEEERSWAADFLLNQEIPPRNGTSLLVGVHPGGSTFDKLWPAENFAKIANSLIQEFGAKIILFGGPDEGDLLKSIREAMTHPPISTEGITLRQFAALVERCSLFLCNDSGPMHIAAALKVPTVAIFGPTDYVRWGPRNENAAIVRRDMECWPCSAHRCKRAFECTKSLPVSDVWDAVRRLLSTSRLQKKKLPADFR